MVSLFKNVIQVTNLDMELTATALRAVAPAILAGVDVTAGVELFKKGSEVAGEALRLNLTATNVNLTAAVTTLWGSSPPAAVSNALRNAVFAGLSSQTSKGERRKRAPQWLGVPGQRGCMRVGLLQVWRHG